MVWVDPWSIKESDRIELINVIEYPTPDGTDIVFIISINGSEGIWYYPSQLIREKGGVVELSPLAMWLIHNAKDLLRGRYFHFIFRVEFEANAYGEFFGALMSGLPDAKEWFRRRVLEEIDKRLREQGLSPDQYMLGINSDEIVMEYDIVGIILGYNPVVKITANIHVWLDISLAWWQWALIIGGAIAFIFGISFTLVRLSEEATKQAYYDYLKAYYEAWQEYYRTISPGEQPPETTPPSEGQPPGQPPSPGTTPPPPPSPPSAPQEGGGNWLIWLILLLLVIGGAGVAYAKRR